MQLSARNQIPPRVTSIKPGEAIANVHLDAVGVEMVASITIEAVQQLGLTRGQQRHRRDQGVRRDTGHRGLDSTVPTLPRPDRRRATWASGRAPAGWARWAPRRAGAGPTIWPARR